MLFLSRSEMGISSVFNLFLCALSFVLTMIILVTQGFLTKESVQHPLKSAIEARPSVVGPVVCNAVTASAVGHWENSNWVSVCLSLVSFFFLTFLSLLTRFRSIVRCQSDLTEPSWLAF